MFKKIFLLIILIALISCKKENVNCEEKFSEIYGKRWALWLGFESIGVTSNNNFSEQEYKKLRKEANDSMSILINCALKQNKNNEILYLYKMKQLYLSDSLNKVEPFLKTIDRKIVKDDIYFQLSLYSLLCKELLTKQKPTEEYKNLLKSYSPTLKSIYKNTGIEEFLVYLIDNDLKEFKKKLAIKYPDTGSITIVYENGKKTVIKDSDSNSILTENEKNRESIIKGIMMRGDNFVFD